MSKKNTPPSYTEPGGPRIVDTHSYKLSPFGPAEQFGGGSNVISANSFCIRLADVPSAFEIFGFGFGSFISGLVSLPVTVDPLPLLLLLLLLFPLPFPRPRPLPLLDPAPAFDDIFPDAILSRPEVSICKSIANLTVNRNRRKKRQLKNFDCVIRFESGRVKKKSRTVI